MVVQSKAQTYGAALDKTLYLATDPRRAGTIVIDVLEVPSRGGPSLGPHRLILASGFVRELHAMIQGQLQITGRRNGHSGVLLL